MKDPFFQALIAPVGFHFGELVDAKVQTLEGVGCGLGVENENIFRKGLRFLCSGSLRSFPSRMQV